MQTATAADVILEYSHVNLPAHDCWVRQAQRNCSYFDVKILCVVLNLSQLVMESQVFHNDTLRVISERRILSELPLDELAKVFHILS